MGAGLDDGRVTSLDERQLDTARLRLEVVRGGGQRRRQPPERRLDGHHRHRLRPRHGGVPLRQPARLLRRVPAPSPAQRHLHFPRQRGPIRPADDVPQHTVQRLARPPRPLAVRRVPVLARALRPGDERVRVVAHDGRHRRRPLSGDLNAAQATAPTSARTSYNALPVGTRLNGRPTIRPLQ